MPSASEWAAAQVELFTKPYAEDHQFVVKSEQIDGQLILTFDAKYMERPRELVGTSAVYAMEFHRLVTFLRSEEGDSVNILCENPDGDQAVVCAGAWTKWLDRRFEGNTTMAALQAAEKARIETEQP